MTFNTAKRIRNLWNALGDLERRRTLGGSELELVMGHITHFCMVRRELLTIFHCVYRFCQRFRGCRAPHVGAVCARSCAASAV